MFVISDKSPATYLRYGRIFYSLFFINLLLSLPAKIVFKSIFIWQNYRQEGDYLTQFVCLAATLLKDEEFIRHFEHSKKQ